MISKPKTIFCDIDGTLCEYPYTGKMVSFDDEIMKIINDNISGDLEDVIRQS